MTKYILVIYSFRNDLLQDIMHYENVQTFRQNLQSKL